MGRCYVQTTEPESSGNELRNHKRQQCFSKVSFYFFSERVPYLALLKVMKHCSINKAVLNYSSLRSMCMIDADHQSNASARRSKLFDFAKKDRKIK